MTQLLIEHVMCAKFLNLLSLSLKVENVRILGLAILLQSFWKNLVISHQRKLSANSKALARLLLTFQASFWPGRGWGNSKISSPFLLLELKIGKTAMEQPRR